MGPYYAYMKKLAEQGLVVKTVDGYALPSPADKLATPNLQSKEVADRYASDHETVSPTEPEDDQEQPERHRLRLKFWEGLLGRPKVKGTRHADIKPSKRDWLGASSGVRGLPFNYVIFQREVRVELYIDRGSGKAAENKQIFDQLHSLKPDIEKTFGAALLWQRLDDKQACRIAYDITLGGYRSDEARWPVIHDAMIDAMARLENALAPHLAKLKTG
jgi:hypothetical protein